MEWKRASLAAVLDYHATEAERGARLCFDLRPGSYNTDDLIAALEQLKAFYEGEQVVLVRDELSAHRSRAMRTWADAQDWLTLERLPAYAPELNPVEMLWSAIKTRKLANVTEAAERGINRTCENDRLSRFFLTHTRLEIHPPT
ncbi:hypothetical protein GCM10007079_04180 [Nocardiopsis terrae]|nr:hypothetical protein GCM10007079_04180 [Nocardiopsis terrae]